MPLQMKGACERCQLALGAGDEAYVCSYECTYCPTCSRELDATCPNCGGELLRRPRRRTAADSPAAAVDPPRLAPDARSSPARLEPLVLEGRYVRLEPLRRDHVPALTEAALSDPAIWAYTRVRVDTPADLERLVDDALALQETGLVLPFAVVERASGHTIGSTRYLAYRPADRCVEIGWTWYARPYWGTAVNPECKLLLLRHAFEGLGCLRVELQTDVRNLRSRAAILRLGAKAEGVLRKYAVIQGGVIRHSVYYSIVDDEWPAVEAGLLARLDPARSASPGTAIQ